MKRQSLKRQALITGASTALVRAMGFALRLYVSRLLGAEALGVMELASGVHMLALTPADFNFTKKTVRINKTYQRIHGRDMITSPKTRKSVRTVEMPDFLCEEMQDYLKSLYKVQKNDRIFPVTKD